MTGAEFQEKYHQWVAESEDAALKELAVAGPNTDEPVAAVRIGNGYALMLLRAAEYATTLFPKGVTVVGRFVSGQVVKG